MKYLKQLFLLLTEAIVRVDPPDGRRHVVVMGGAATWLWPDSVNRETADRTRS